MEALMPAEIRIPKLGMSVTEVTLVEWMFGDGETVEKGDVLYTVETDKSTTEIEAQESGVLHVTGEEGESYRIGDVIGTIG
ncbi:MAG: dihydrolipoamide acyltransferase [Blastomonas sp.]|jgi:pyruvate/2-oxoglutarate dehydrogenase complex dihydrolipoamide acyltransferase (E2) component|nr:dihydrolipoamide acyltransferase [Blastomonas sp.]